MKNNILEMSKRATKNGRVAIKIALLKIHDEADDTNSNGLHWKEEYVKKNMDSAIGMPICAEFADKEKSAPLGHGLTGEITNSDGLSEPVFENSETVGVIDSVAIETVKIDGEDVKVLCGNGYIFSHRYPKLVKWLRQNYALDKVDTSIEIVGLPENDNQITYEEGATQEFRTPVEFQFSGTAILSVMPSDENAIVLEVAQKIDVVQKPNKEEKIKMEFEMNEIKSVIADTLAELNNKSAEYEAQISELNAKISELNETVAQKDVELNEKEQQIVEINASVTELKAALDKLNADHETYWAERDLLEHELVKAKVAEKLGEMDAALEVFSDDEKNACESEINAVKESIEACEKKEDLESKTSEINSLVGKIYEEIGKASKKAEAEAKAEEEAKIAEINSKVEAEDIFSEITVENDNEDDEDVNIF